MLSKVTAYTLDSLGHIQNQETSVSQHHFRHVYPYPPIYRPSQTFLCLYPNSRALHGRDLYYSRVIMPCWWERMVLIWPPLRWNCKVRPQLGFRSDKIGTVCVSLELMVLVMGKMILVFREYFKFCIVLESLIKYV